MQREMGIVPKMAEKSQGAHDNPTKSVKSNIFSLFINLLPEIQFTAV
jgi:hypothetical protein